MAGKLSGGAIEANTITVTQLTKAVNDKANNAYTQANNAYAQANAAYTAANNASGGFSKSFLLGGI
jgi:hypothetical protein